MVQHIFQFMSLESGVDRDKNGPDFAEGIFTVKPLNRVNQQNRNMIPFFYP